jgi:hypothetical protein
MKRIKVRFHNGLVLWLSETEALRYGSLVEILERK